MPRHLSPLFLVPLGLLSLACSSVQRPTASFQSAEVGGLSPEGFTLNFGFDVENPNDFDLPIRNADYALSFGGVKVIDDQASPSGSLRAGGRTNVTVPVRLSFDDLLKAGRAIRAGGGDIPYEFDGALAFGGGGSGLATLGMPDRIPLRYSGTLPLRRLLSDPQVLLNSPAARRLAQWGLGSLMGG
jgi:LEA14-like dessication related protein